MIVFSKTLKRYQDEYGDLLWGDLLWRVVAMIESPDGSYPDVQRGTLLGEVPVLYGELHGDGWW